MKRGEAPVYVWHWVVIIVAVATALVVRGRLDKPEPVESVEDQYVRNTLDTRFVAALYPKITRNAAPDSMSRSLFAEHMSELKNAGYRTVGLQEICDLYYSGKALPEKAVAVLLDGYRDTRLNAVPVIDELGLRATVMLNVEAMRQSSRSFMSWHDVKIMQRDPRWNFGVRTTGDDDLREQLEYLRDRVPDIRACGISAPTDLADSVRSLQDGIVFFPPGDGDGYNNSDTDPSGLSLLRVAAEQDGHSLVEMLANISTQAPRVANGFTEEGRRLNWISTCGRNRVVDTMLELSAEPSRSSADVWSVGTFDWTDVDIAVKFEVTGGRQFWAYARFADNDSFIRLGCDGERLYLQEKVAGAKVRNLKVIELDTGLSQFHDLRLILRGTYAIAYLDGQKTSTRPFRVDDSIASGKIGFAIWDSSPGVARCRIASASIRRLPCIALMDMSRYRDRPGWVAENSDYLSYVCPGDLSVDTSGIQSDIDGYNAILILSAYSGHTLVPTVLLDESDLGTRDSGDLAGSLVNLVRNNRLEGIHLDCRKCQSEKASLELTEILAALKADSPWSKLILSLSAQSYRSCQELLELADLLVVQIEGRELDLLNDVPRPFRLKTLLRIQTDDLRTLAGGRASAQNGQATGDFKGSADYVVQNLDLKGVALCKD